MSKCASKAKVNMFTFGKLGISIFLFTRSVSVAGHFCTDRCHRWGGGGGSCGGGGSVPSGQSYLNANC